MMKRSTLLVWVAAAAVLAQLVAVDLLAKGLILAHFERGVRAAWPPLASHLEQRYANVPRLVRGAVAFLKQDDDATAALTAAYGRFEAASDMNAKIAAALQTEEALMDLLHEQLREYPKMTSEYDFIVARRSFQVSAQLMRPSVRAYNAAVSRCRAYAAFPVNDLVADALGVHRELLRARPRPAPPPAEGTPAGGG